MMHYLFGKITLKDMKRRIRLTEGDLRRIVNESVRMCLNENQLTDKLHDLIEKYGHKVVLTAALAGLAAGGYSAASNYADYGSIYPKESSKTHMFGYNMPSDHRAFYGDYADGDHASLWQAHGENAAAKNAQWR